MKFSRLTIAAAAVAMICAGCSAAGGPTVESPTLVPVTHSAEASTGPETASSAPRTPRSSSGWEINDLSPFAGDWKLIGTRDAGDPISSQADVRLKIEPAFVSGSFSGCYDFESEASALDQTMFIEDDAFRIRGTCPDPKIEAASDWLHEHLTARPTLSMEGDRMVITDNGRATIWAAIPPAPYESASPLPSVVPPPVHR